MSQKIKILVQKRSFQIIIVVLSIIFYFLYSFGKFDLFPSDEDVYFQTGLLFKLPYSEFGNLLYPMGIYILSFFISDSINLAYSYFFILSIAMFLALLWYLKKYSGSFWASFFIAACFLFSDFQVNLQPRITILNLIFGLLFLGLIVDKKPLYANWGITSVGLLLCNYVSRPEFYWFFLIATIVFVFQTIRSKEITGNKKIFVLSAFAVFIALFYIIGGGINEPGKLKVAFIQHFFDNYQVWTGKNFDYDEEFLVFDKIYGKVNSDIELITANPSFFFKHVLFNFKNYFLVTLKIFKSCFYDVFVIFFHNKTKYAFTIFCFLLIICIDIKQTLLTFWKIIKVYLPKFPYLVLFMLPTFVAVLLVFPRFHYTILHVPFYFLLLAFLFVSLKFRTPKLKNIALYLFTISYFIGVLAHYPSRIKLPSHVGFYKYMADVAKGRKLNLLSNDYFGFNYYKTNYTMFSWEVGKTDLVKLVNSQKYDLIAFYQMDLEVADNRQFVTEGYKSTNYIRIEKFEGIKRYIFVKPELEARFKIQ